jgi:ABC-type uncharacterized transport system ATPase subunit
MGKRIEERPPVSRTGGLFTLDKGVRPCRVGHVIRVAHLTKEFRRPVRKIGPFGALRTFFSTEYTTVKAVNDISFTIDEWEMVGYIGPNGAGKSTSIKMLTGILVPTSGTVEVNGLSPQRDRVANAALAGLPVAGGGAGCPAGGAALE